MNARGAVLVETAFVMSVVLMVLFGAMQLSLLAYAQASQDGAAFVAARAYAQNPSAGASPAEAAAHKIFAHVPVSAFVLTPSAGQVAVTVQGTAGGLPVAGTPATFAVNALASEIVSGASGATFGATMTLGNYYTSPGDTNATPGLLRPRAMLLAQTFGISPASRFAEWYCRQAVYAALQIPTTTAADQNCQQQGQHSGQCDGGNGSGTNPWFDPMLYTSPLDPIYDWDTGATCA